MAIRSKHKKKFKVKKNKLASAGAVIIVLLLATIGTEYFLSSHAATPNPWPSSPSDIEANICGNSSVLTGPSTAPPGAVTIPAGDDDPTWDNNYSSLAPNTTYYFAAGVHTIGTGEYDSFSPDNGDTFIGAPGAILSGQGDNQSAFGGTATGVTIEYLTVEDFEAPQGQMVVNHDGGASWTIKYDTVENNGGAGVGMGTSNVVSENCLTNNTEYGFSSFGGSSSVTLTNNEISLNDSGGQYDQPGGISCGCAGGGKFWETSGGTVTNNYVHNNGEVGIWVDTNNAGFNISDNYINNNYAEGIMYEASYNYSITDNAVLDNGWGAAAVSPGNWYPGIYISESGGDSRVTAGGYSGDATISGNNLTDNWDGVLLWENANRYCSDGSDTPCTLVNPSSFTVASCKANLATAIAGTNTGSPSADYYDGCRWKTQNVTVTDNTFNFTSADIPNCSTSNWCGRMGLFSNYGSTAPYTSSSIPTAITFNQGNEFSDNTYSGAWTFEVWNQGSGDNPVSFSIWSAAITDKCDTSGEISSGACDSGFGQDAGSAFNTSSSTNNSNPTVSITSPSSNAEIYSNNAASSTITASASANDGGSITSVQLLVNGTIVATDTSSPYNFNLNTLNYHNGTYGVEVKATDDQGNTSTASENIYISNGDLDGSGSVGLFDLTTLASHWGQSGTYQQGNITNNGPIGIFDLSALANNWGWSEQ